MTFERRRRGTLALLCKAHVVAEHAPAPSNHDPDPPQRTSRTVPSIAAQVTRPSQTPAHAAIHARANAVPIAASHPARAAEVCSDASRRLAPRSLARRAARVDAPVPQASPAAAQDPARIGPHGGARPVLLHAPAARKRSASAAEGASVPLSPFAPLRARSGRSRSLRGHCAGSASPVPGLAPQGTRTTIRTTIHARQSTLLHIRPRIGR